MRPVSLVGPHSLRSEYRAAPALEFWVIVVVRSCARPWRTLSHCSGRRRACEAV